MKRRFSSLELLLIFVSVLLLLCSAALSVVAWFGLRSEGPGDLMVLRGHMVITGGAEFSEELTNSSSLLFKSLAYDVQNLVFRAFSLSELSTVFTSCQVLLFRRGSVVVTFDLWFNHPIPAEEAERQLEVGLQEAEGSGLVIDKNSIKISETSEWPTEAPPTVTPSPETSEWPTEAPPTVTPSPVACPPDQVACADRSQCLLVDQLCDGAADCPDQSDEDAAVCATRCDGQFELTDQRGTISSSETNDRRFCRWIIRVSEGFAVQIDILRFNSQEFIDTIRLYEGVGAGKRLTAELSGSAHPSRVWLFTNQCTIEFTSDDVNFLSSFNATYNAVSISSISAQQKLSCSFEDGLCLWRQQLDFEEDDGDWARISGATFPPQSGPSVDHTLGNSSGFYIIPPPSPGQWLQSFRIQSLPLAPPPASMCLSFWYHMYGVDVYRLSVLLLHPPDAVTVVFQKDGNYGDSWHYGQVTLNLTTETTVVFEALKNGGRFNDIALDDITLTMEPCGPAPPEPTNVPLPTTPPPMPADCGGPFDLWEPNSTFSSPNYPKSYGAEASCLWTLHAPEGQNIQLHFLDLDVEATFDVVEVRDGAGINSTLLAVLTGSTGPAHDLLSQTNQMMVWFFTDKSGHGRGFNANFTSGVNLGSPALCAEGQFQCASGACLHGNSQCDGVVDCPDASDESDCVLQMDSSSALQFRLGFSLLTVCSDTWSSQLSVFTCQYLGYRWGAESLLPASPDDAPFTNISHTNGALQTTASETCSSNAVISLTCDNHPCGERLVSNDSAQIAPAAGEGKVVGGADAVKGAWPWMVSLWWQGRHVCGASLIGEEWLLTAAHCVYGKNVHLSYWSAVIGLHAQSGVTSADVQTRNIDQIIIHPEYNRQTKQADIAMMHLQQQINFTESIQPVCFPPKGHDPTAGSRCFIAGWGSLEEDGSLPDVLQDAQVPLVDQDECQLLLPEYTITPSMLCAGLPEGGVDSCQGDSGGPLMCEEDGRWSVIGVTSFGVGCARPQRPGVYARVSVFTSWIAQTRRSAHSALGPMSSS